MGAGTILARLPAVALAKAGSATPAPNMGEATLRSFSEEGERSHKVRVRIMWRNHRRRRTEILAAIHSVKRLHHSIFHLLSLCFFVMQE